MLFPIRQQLLDHMNESAVYTEGDLKSFRTRLDELREIVHKDTESGLHPPAMTKLLDRKLNECGMFTSTILLHLHLPLPT